MLFIQILQNGSTALTFEFNSSLLLLVDLLNKLYAWEVWDDTAMDATMAMS